MAFKIVEDVNLLIEELELVSIIHGEWKKNNQKNHKAGKIVLFLVVDSTKQF